MTHHHHRHYYYSHPHPNAHPRPPHHHHHDQQFQFHLVNLGCFAAAVYKYVGAERRTIAQTATRLASSYCEQLLLAGVVSVPESAFLALELPLNCNLLSRLIACVVMIELTEHHGTERRQLPADRLSACSMS